jgi:hypothetical protein
MCLDMIVGGCIYTDTSCVREGWRLGWWVYGRSHAELIDILSGEWVGYMLTLCMCVSGGVGVGCAESALDAAFAKRLDNPNEQQPLLTDEQMQVPRVGVYMCVCVCMWMCMMGV